MKTSLKIFGLLLIFTGTSCEDVVDIPLEESEPRLVVEASILSYKDSESNIQQIRLTETAPFYDEEIPTVENASVKIISEAGLEYDFIHTSEGYYINENLNPILGETYELEIIYNDEVYTATETMMGVTDIDFIEQTATGGFAGDEIEVKVFYTDPVNEPNYYLFIFRNKKISLEIYEDKFTDGNQIFGYYSNEDIKPGDTIDIEMYGISKSYYEYLFILRAQIGENSGGPFETQPATVKGNVINRSNKENYPFGYFHLSEVDTSTYIVK
ncbi:MAG: DUF4249 domain-containing protein [Salegentibacter sp.]|uniref:DUF4249 domain-containing protein n=1 Tax=Salegentibacter flavus TaxID=287099 RepID=A0A1I4Y1Y3_9FLAO|nr:MULTISPECIES: DUF4249 domain-containing protein [Salegentibacter]MDR9457934.1 DUF4249 domain-containing protein [Salegentibacter sp.]SFN32138.1 protein of unknown function [Salegentibacter flavus]